MLKSLFRFFGFAKESVALEKFDPIYGLSKRSLEEWLSHNPALAKEYNAKLKIRSITARQIRSS
jgi:hypothetical protein